MRMCWPQIVVFCLILLASADARAQSLDEMAGQMIMVGFRGDNVGSAGILAVQADLEAGRLGGIMYLRHNVDSLDAVARINQRLLALDLAQPPLIALDQEGGAVERLTSSVGFTELPSAEAMARTHSPASAQQAYASMAFSLFELGFNVNFGPVVDLNSNPDNPVIARYGRAFSADAEIVSQYATSFIVAHRGAGVLTALKHFPGHGSSATDSHEGFVDVSDSWAPDELVPYQTLISGVGVDMVMAGHLYNSRGSTRSELQLPASLSQYWIDGVLRGELGFEGVVISDDMEMGAIRSLFGLEVAVIRAVFAGSDILLFSNTADYRTSLAREVQAILVEKAANDPKFRARIEESFARIVLMKTGL